MSKRRTDMENRRFGALVTMTFLSKVKHSYWRCRCDCGNIVEKDQCGLLSGKYISCGCIPKYVNETHPFWKGCGKLSGQYFSSLRCRAKKKEIPFNITIDDAWRLFELQNGKCALTGLDLQFASLREQRLGHQQTASLDRIDSNIGYELSNIQWVHKYVNWMKNDLPMDEFIRMCKLVAAKVA